MENDHFFFLFFLFFLKGYKDIIIILGYSITMKEGTIQFRDQKVKEKRRISKWALWHLLMNEMQIVLRNYISMRPFILINSSLLDDDFCLWGNYDEEWCPALPEQTSILVLVSGFIFTLLHERERSYVAPLNERERSNEAQKISWFDNIVRYSTL